MFSDESNDDELDFLDSVSKMPNSTIENHHRSSIQILEELLNGTKNIPGIITSYQNTIKLQVDTHHEQQEQEQQRCQQNEQKRQEIEEHRREALDSSRTKETRRVVREVGTILEA